MEPILSKVIRQRASIHPHREAYVFEGRSVSYIEFHERACKAGRMLQDHGLAKGDRVGILCLNGVEAVDLVFGAIMAGVVPVSLPWKAVPQEYASIIADAGVQHVFAAPMFLPALAVLPGTVAVHPLDAELKKEMDAVKALEVVAQNAGDMAAIIYTSGTTGTPKGVMLSHANLYACASLCAMETPGFGPTTRLLVCGPLYSIFGFGAFFSSLYTGCTAVLLPMFDPGGTLSAIQDESVTHALFAPIMMRAMAAVPDATSFDMRTLQHIQYGGSPMPEALMRVVMELFQCDLTQVYGLTETTGVGCALRYDDHRAILSTTAQGRVPPIASAGRPGVGVQLAICNDGGERVTVGEVGEVRIKGDIVSMGYWGDREEKERFLADGWFLTGDMGVLDEAGYLTLVDRRNDMIVSKGVNIFPAEVELVLERHPDVKECAVVSAPNEDLGEEVCAVVVTTRSDLDLLEVRKWCAGELADNKLPSRLEFMEALPRTLTGKVLRRAVRAPFWKNEPKGVKG